MKFPLSRVSRSAAVVAIAALALAGCGSDTSSSNTSGDPAAADKYAPGTTITVWADETRTPVITEIGKSFETEKGVTVKVVQKDFDTLKDELTTQGPAGKGPDVIVGAHDWIGGLVDSGSIAPIQLGNVADTLQDVAVKAVTYDGQTYGLPYAVENIALVRNTALAPQAPATWDDMVKTGQQLVSAKKAKFPFVLQAEAPNGDPYHAYPLQASFGSSVFGTAADGSADATKLTLGDANGVKFAQWLGAQGKAGLLAPTMTYDIGQDAFSKGQTPYMITGPWGVEGLPASVKVSIDPIPSAGGQPATPLVGVQAFMVSKYSKQGIAANDFVVNYLGSEDAQTKLSTAGGRPSANKAVFAANQSDPILAGFGKVGESGVPTPNVAAMGAVWTEWGKAEVAILKGADPQSTWTQMVAKVQKAIDGS